MAAQHQYLTGAERRELHDLAVAGARALNAAGDDGNRLMELLRRSLADVQHGRDVGASLRRDLRTARQHAAAAREEAAQARQHLTSAEDELAEWRNGRHAEQLPLDDDEPLFDNALGEYPPLDGQKFMRRRGQWLPIQDAAAVDTYQPAR